jgi:hypothetical protein
MDREEIKKEVEYVINMVAGKMCSFDKGVNKILALLSHPESESKELLYRKCGECGKFYPDKDCISAFQCPECMCYSHEMNTVTQFGKEVGAYCMKCGYWKSSELSPDSEERVEVKDSKWVIGSVKERFKQLKHKGWDWNSFYNGWIEGRVNSLGTGMDKLGEERVLQQVEEGVEGEEKLIKTEYLADSNGNIYTNTMPRVRLADGTKHDGTTVGEFYHVYFSMNKLSPQTTEGESK